MRINMLIHIPLSSIGVKCLLGLPALHRQVHVHACNLHKTNHDPLCYDILCSQGFIVFAGVRNQADADSLTSSTANDRIKPVMLDVTSDVSVCEALAFVQRNLRAGEKLMGLVNNAGGHDLAV